MPIKLTSGTPRRNEPATGQLRARKGFLKSIRANLILVLCILLIPTLMIQVYTYYDKFESRRAGELQANLEVARAVAKAFESFVQNIFGDELIIGFACARRPTKDQNQILLEALTAHPALWNLSWADPRGSVLASTGSESIGRNLYDNPFFQELASGQDYVVTNLIHSESTGKGHFFVGRAVRGESGDLLGVLIADVLPERLDTVIGIKRLKGAGVGLVDRQGRLAISYPQENYTWEQRNSLSAYPIIKDALESKEVVATVVSNFDGVNRLVAFVPIPSIGWVAAATLSVHDAMVDIRASLVPGTIIFLLITIAVSLIAMNVSRRISDSIEMLRDHALSLGRGNNQQSLIQSGIVELDDLINSFNKMSDDLISKEEELRKSRDDLELKVQERTVELETYMRKLEESNQALQDFASIASHDLQEPLRKVSAFGNMLKQKCGTSLEDEGRDYLERMLNANQRMQSLLKGLLDYSRVATAPDPFVNVELKQIIREVLSDLEVRIEKSGAEVQVGDLPALEADPTQMRQLFQNLIGNAMKFHQEGEKPVVKVSCFAVDSNYHQIIVEDKGVGFEERYLERIFAPFQRLHGKSEFEGTGMGLAICKKIVERHGGSISAKSAPGAGSTFIVTLPVKQNT